MKLLLKEVRDCRVCEAHLPHGPRPVVQASPEAKLLIVGQAPGRIVHETGIPWNDASGDRLRQWLHLPRDVFYDAARIAIVPTGLCFPGTGRSGDLPPRRECAPLWHGRLLEAMPDIRLTLLIGAHAQKYYLRENNKSTLTETVRHYEEYLPRYFPLPHPSPRNRLWLAANRWFEQDVVTVLRREVERALAT
jgi:uracil-DNA glycosylase